MANPVQRVPSRQNLRSNMGMARELGFLEFNTLDSVAWEADFLGDALPTELQSTAASGAVLSITGGVNGLATIVTQASNDAYADTTLGPDFLAQCMCVMAARVHIDAITDSKMEIGFSDAASGTDAGAVLLNGAVAGTYTANATDMAVWAFDTDSANDVWHVVSTYNQNATDTITGEASSTSSYGSGAPVAGTFETLIVALEGTRSAGTTDAWTSPSTAHFYRLNANGYQVDKKKLTTGPTSNTLLTPHINVTTRNGTANTVTIDFIKVWQRRTAD